MSAKDRVYRGETGGPISKGGGPPVPYHKHDYRYEVSQGPDGTSRCLGITDYDPVSGSSHGISDPRYTHTASDNHYHPIPAPDGDPLNPPKSLNVLQALTKEDKDLAETVDGWVKMITDDMTSVAYSTGQGLQTKKAPNPMTNPQNKKALAKYRKKKYNQDVQK